MPKLEPTTIDFETLPIGTRAAKTHPPEPVGVAIKPWGRTSVYYRWGHKAGGNNCDRATATQRLRDVWGGDLLMHHKRFDVEVAVAKLGLPMPSWEKVHDTLFELFLDDPRQANLGLKPSATRLLGLPPEERDAVADWLMLHQPVEGVRITKKTAGAYIAYAPGDVVAPYANGDTTRTEKIHRKLYPSIKRRGMLAAYQTELELDPLLMAVEQTGIRVDLSALEVDAARYGAVLDDLDIWFRRRLRAKDLNIDSGDELAEALLRSGTVDDLPLTATGKRQTNREALQYAVKDPTILARLVYRGRLQAYLSTFMVPWLETARMTNGLVYASWGAVRDAGREGGGPPGARTGRLSSSPNFQNLPKEREAESPKGLPPLPVVRRYVIPRSKGQVLVDRDYNQQELRIFAHFEDDVMLQRYLDDPWLDFHDTARDLIAQATGREYDRTTVKGTFFGLLYGMGQRKLAQRNQTTVEEAKRLKASILTAVPTLKALYADIKARVKQNLPVKTWAGREYLCEPPTLHEGRIWSFDYKLLNVIIQGSAADCTKRALIAWRKAAPPEHRLILTAHDEFLVSGPKKDLKKAHDILRAAMASVTFSVPMLSDGKWSDKSWGDLEPYDKKGKVLV